MADGVIKQIQIGTTLYDLHDARIDGENNDGLQKRLETLEGNAMTFRLDPGDRYAGLARGISKANDDYMRTTVRGLIPHTQSINGNGQIGTSSWPFSEVHAKTLNGSLNAKYITGTLAAANGGTGSTAYGSTLRNSDMNTSKAIKSATWTNLGGLALKSGTWFVSYGAYFANNSTGRRYMALSPEKAAPNANYLRATGISMTALTNSVTYMSNSWFTNVANIYLYVNQSSGGNLNVSGFLKAFRLT